MSEEPFITLPPLAPELRAAIDARLAAAAAGTRPLCVVEPAIDTAAQAVIAERRRQIEKFGHEPDADDRLPRCWLLRQAQVRLLDAMDLVFGHPTPVDLQRAERRVTQAAALCLAEIDRIHRQRDQQGDAS